MPHIQFAILLGMTVALGPLALDAYLPAFPRIADDLGAMNSDIGLTLSAYVASLGLAQLIGGPLSDRYGRQRILFSGLAIFAASAMMVAQAQTLSEMLTWRATQGIGGALCAVSVPALVRDQFRGSESARLFGLIGLMMFIAPAAAPSIGTLLLMISDWPAIFVMLACYAAMLAILLHFALFRRLPPREPESTPVHTLVTNYLFVLRHPQPCASLHSRPWRSAPCSYSSLTPLSFYQEWFGLSSTLFSALFAANIGGMATFNLLNRKLLLHFESVILLRIWVFLQGRRHRRARRLYLAGDTLLGGCRLHHCGHRLHGWSGAQQHGQCTGVFPKLGGTASALLGASQFTVAGQSAPHRRRSPAERCCPSC